MQDDCRQSLPAAAPALTADQRRRIGHAWAAIACLRRSTPLAMRLEPAEARSGRCQHLPSPGGRACALRRLGPHAHSAGWTATVSRHGRRCLHYTPPVVGVSRRKPPRDASSVLRGRRSFRGWTARPIPGWLPALRFVRGGLRSLALPAPQPHASAWARTPHLDRACTRSAPAALRQLAWGRVRLRVSTGACRCCPPSFGGGSNPIPPPFHGKRTSRPLPSAVPGLQRPGTAHGERRSALCRIKAEPWRVASRPALTPLHAAGSAAPALQRDG